MDEKGQPNIGALETRMHNTKREEKQGRREVQINRLRHLSKEINKIPEKKLDVRRTFGEHLLNMP